MRTSLDELRKLKNMATQMSMHSIAELIGSIVNILEEKQVLERRLQHLLKSDYIRSFDEYDPRSHTYKRNIEDADKGVTDKEIRYKQKPALFVQRDTHLDKQLLGHVKSMSFEPENIEPYTDGCGAILGYTHTSAPTITLHLEED